MIKLKKDNEVLASILARGHFKQLVSEMIKPEVACRPYLKIDTEATTKRPRERRCIVCFSPSDAENNSWRKTSRSAHGSWCTLFSRLCWLYRPAWMWLIGIITEWSHGVTALSTRVRALIGLKEYSRLSPTTTWTRLPFISKCTRIWFGPDAS